MSYWQFLSFQVHIQTIGILVSEKSELQTALSYTQQAARQKTGVLFCMRGCCLNSFGHCHCILCVYDAFDGLSWSVWADLSVHVCLCRGCWGAEQSSPGHQTESLWAWKNTLLHLHTTKTVGKGKHTHILMLLHKMQYVFIFYVRKNLYIIRVFFFLF